MEEEMMDDLYRELETKISHHGEATFSARVMAREIQKSLAVCNLEDNMAKISLVKEVPVHEVDCGILSTFCVHLVDKLMSSHMGEDERFVERLMDLVASLAVLSGESVVKELVERFSMYSRAILERVRKRALNFLSVLVTHSLEHFREDSNDLVSIMEDPIVVRLKDKSKAVRMNAIEASTRLFENRSYSENLLSSILWNLSHDPSAACRSAAAIALPLNETTIEHIVERIRDSEKIVRVAALQALTANQDSVSLMSTDVFVDVIRGGFSERCMATKEAMLSFVLCNWIAYMDYNVIQVLRQVDVVAHENECGVLISEIILSLEQCTYETPEYLEDADIQALKTSFLRQKRMFVQSIEMNTTLEPEETLLFRLAHFKGVESPDMLSPEHYSICSSLDTSKLCSQISRYSLAFQQAIKEEDENRQEECGFQCFQLVQIAGLVSLCEEGSKRHFVNFIESFLFSKSTAHELVDRSTSIFFSFHGKETNCFGIIYSVLHRLFHEVGEDDKPESWSTTRYLHILAPTLETVPTHTIDEDLIAHFSTTIAVSITDDDHAVRELAVVCLGKLGFFHPPIHVWKEIQRILLEVATNEKEKLAVRSQALLSLCDLAILSQEDSQLQQCPFDSPSLVHILDILIGSRNTSVVALVGEISAKLLLDGRSSNRKLLASLLAIYFDPSQKDDNDIEYAEARDVGNPIRLQQLLSVFFPVFVLQSDFHRNALVESLHLAFEYSSKASRDRPLKQGTKFPMLKMAEYIVAISDEVYSGSLAISICIQVARFLLSAPSLSGAQSRAFCNFVLQQVMKTEPESNAYVRELNLLLEDLQMIVCDEVGVQLLSHAAERLAVDLEASRADDSMSTSDSESSSFEQTNTNSGVLMDSSTNAADCFNSKRYRIKRKQTSA